MRRLPPRDNISLQLGRQWLDFFRGKQGTIGVVHGRTGRTFVTTVREAP
jgi:hypothetical protein